MTHNQVQKLSELHADGWTSIVNPNDPDHLIDGGPTFVLHPDGRTFTVEGDGSLKEYKA
jgi:hypothetical protein